MIWSTSYNDFIKDQWDLFEDYLSCAAIVTIYGYSAPKTDADAIEKLKNAFTRIAKMRYLDQIQIIERPGFNHNEISDAWEDLSEYVHGHLKIEEAFFDTYLAEFPRRSVEGYVKRNITGWWGPSNKSFDKEKGVNYVLVVIFLTYRIEQFGRGECCMTIWAMIIVISKAAAFWTVTNFDIAVKK